MLNVLTKLPKFQDVTNQYQQNINTKFVEKKILKRKINIIKTESIINEFDNIPPSPISTIASGPRSITINLCYTTLNN